MFVVYYKGKDEKYHSYDGNKFRAQFKRPDGFEVQKGFDVNKKGLKEFHKKIEVDSKELEEKGILKQNVTSFKSETQARFNILNSYIPDDYKMQKGKGWFSQFPNIDLEEHVFMNNCNNMGLLYTKTGIFKNVSAYDINSFFSRILGGKQSNFKIPISKPIFKTISEIPDKLEYGIYRVMITYNGKKTDDIFKLFNFSKAHHYTHIDLKQALYY